MRNTFFALVSAFFVLTSASAQTQSKEDGSWQDSMSVSSSKSLANSSFDVRVTETTTMTDCTRVHKSKNRFVDNCTTVTKTRYLGSDSAAASAASSQMSHSLSSGLSGVSSSQGISTKSADRAMNRH